MTVLLADTTDFMVWPKGSGECWKLWEGVREVWLHHHAEGRLSGAEPSPSHFADEETEAQEIHRHQLQSSPHSLQLKKRKEGRKEDPAQLKINK